MKLLALAILCISCAHAPRAVGPAESVSIDTTVPGRYSSVADGREATALLGRDLNVTHGPAAPAGSYVATALVPAADGLMRWLLVVDRDGHVLRLRDGRVEDVSVRYGVGGLKVVDLCSLDATHLAFFTRDETILVGEGAAKRFAVGGATHACGGGHLARSSHELVVWDGAWTSYPIVARHFAFTDDGALWVAHGHELYRAQHGQLLLEHDAGTSIDGLSGGASLILRMGTTLARFDGAQRIPLAGVEVEAGTRLVSSNDSLWLLGPQSARRVAFTIAPIAAHGWGTIAPVVAHSCGTCHEAGGKGGFDLTNESAWITRRDDIKQRVLEDRDMPPEGAPPGAHITDGERQAVRSWLSGSK